jgi:acyl-[acyl-carrier-protein]-phospholipid O-acyltransferase/long-chain-fatty-acid--[acyl-carrier-protein] ligase
VGSNIQSIDDAVILTAKDTALGVLPFFHSYGYTATLWTMLALPPRGVYHFSPLEAKPIGKLAKKYDATILMATPTFLRTYLKRCAPDELSKLEIVFASAERLPKELSDAFESKFGVRPKEAYGATELSPLGCVNVPEAKCHKDHPQGSKEGTVGRPIPGVRVKTIDVDTGENLPPLSEGMLLFTGDNVMLGYMDQPEQTAKVIRDGWYVTGDIGMIDEEGFVRITGRLSRFSKIGGEMVPHIKIEETLQGLMAEDEEQLVAAVTAVSDDSKGERLVVLHTAVKQTPREICKKLAEAGLPNLWIPSPDSFVEVDELPVLGTGKLDLKALKERALELFGQTTS